MVDTKEKQNKYKVKCEMAFTITELFTTFIQFI